MGEMITEVHDPACSRDRIEGLRRNPGECCDSLSDNDKLALDR